MWGPELDELVEDLSEVKTCPSTINGVEYECGRSDPTWWPYPDGEGNVTHSQCNWIRSVSFTWKHKDYLILIKFYYIKFNYRGTEIFQTEAEHTLWLSIFSYGSFPLAYITCYAFISHIIMHLCKYIYLVIKTIWFLIFTYKSNMHFMKISKYLWYRGTDAYQFPPFLNKRKDEDLWIFTTDLCRSMKLKFNKEDDIDGIDIYRYIVPTGILKVAILFNLLEKSFFTL